MSDYTLYYWPVPFRGQFIRAALAFANRRWTEVDDDIIAALMDGPVLAMPVPFMGPPVLVDHRAEAAISQMPAILSYLGETLNLLSREPVRRALTIKVINDANDVSDELTLDGGRQMWTPRRWATFRPRLMKWMFLWEETGRRHGLTRTTGYLLGGEAPDLADIVTATLWTTIADRFPALSILLDDTAPLTAALARRISALPALAALADSAFDHYGESWSGGRIEASLRRVLAS